MKKIAKMSLVAAVAVAGLTNANAGALEDAIKNTSILGYATIRYDDRTKDNTSATSPVDYSNSTNVQHKIAVGLVSKITDDISYTFVGAVTDSTNTGSGDGVSYMGGNFYSVYSNFTYTGFQNTSIIFGQQGLNTPQTVVYDTIAGTQEGTGIAAVTTLGPVTVVAGFMNDTNLAGGDSLKGTTYTSGAINAIGSAINSADLYILQANAKFAGVSLDGTYLDLEDIFESYSIGAKGSIDLDMVKLTPYARYTDLQMDDAAATLTGLAKDNSLWYVGTKFKAGIVGGNIGYGETGKDGGLVAVDNDAEAAFQGWATVINGSADASILKTNLNVDVMSGVNVAINYNTQEVVNTDTDEIYGQLTYKPAKNIMAYLRYGTVEKDGAEDAQRGRIHVQYTF